MECDCFLQAMVSCQMLSELEEVIQYKLVPERREIIRQIWWERLQVCLSRDQGWRCQCAGMHSSPSSHCGGSADLAMPLSGAAAHLLAWLQAACLPLSWLVEVWGFH